MTKALPDPPFDTLKTQHLPFGCGDVPHGPLFAVVEGIPVEDALIHASLHLQTVLSMAQHAVEHTSDAGLGMLWAAVHSTEMAKALVDSLLDARA